MSRVSMKRKHETSVSIQEQDGKPYGVFLFYIHNIPMYAYRYGTAPCVGDIRHALNINEDNDLYNKLLFKYSEHKYQQLVDNEDVIPKDSNCEFHVIYLNSDDESSEDDCIRQ